MKTKLTKKQVNDDLEDVYSIYAGKVTGRYEGLYQTECVTDIQKIFWNVIQDARFQYGTKKEQYNEVYKRLGLPVGESKEFKKSLGGIIIRNLPANQKYDFIGAGSFAEGEGWLCENCGRLIRHWNEVKDHNNKHYLIGSECINTVLQYDANEDWEAMQLIAEANRLKRRRAQILKIVKDGGRVEKEDNMFTIYNKYDHLAGWVNEEKYNQMFRKGIKN